MGNILGVLQKQSGCWTKSLNGKKHVYVDHEQGSQITPLIGIYICIYERFSQVVVLPAAFLFGRAI